MFHLLTCAQMSWWMFLLAPMPVIAPRVGWVSKRLHSSHTKVACSHLLAFEQRTRWLFLLAPMPVIGPMVGCVATRFHSSHTRFDRSSLLAGAQMARWLIRLAPMPWIWATRTLLDRICSHMRSRHGGCSCLHPCQGLSQYWLLGII